MTFASDLDGQRRPKGTFRIKGEDRKSPRSKLTSLYVLVKEEDSQLVDQER
jgi:hypothetical protein